MLPFFPGKLEGIIHKVADALPHPCLVDSYGQVFGLFKDEFNVRVERQRRVKLMNTLHKLSQANPLEVERRQAVFSL